MWRFIAPLLWKSWCIRKRHYIATLMEIFTPIGLFILLLYLKSSVPNSQGEVVPVSIFKPVSKDLLMSAPKRQHSDIIRIAFAPKNNFQINSIIERVNSTLRNNGYSVSFIPADSENEISKIFFELYGNTTVFGDMIFGLIFTKSLSYTLRPISSSFQTENIYPAFSTPGPGFGFYSYIKEGFVLLQIAINDAIYLLKNPGKEPIDFNLTEFPYPSYHKVEQFKLFFSLIIPLIALFGYYSFVPNLISNAIQEKNSGSREWMGMVGIPRIMVLFSWVLHAMSLYFFTNIICCGILVANIWSNPVLSSSNIFFVWLVLFLFCTCTVFFVLAVTSFINNPNVAVMFGTFAWIIPSVAASNYQNAKNMSYGLKMLSSFFPSCSLNWAFTAISGYEANRETISFSNLFAVTSGKNEISLGVSLLFLFFTCFLYALIFLYIDSIKPGKFGRARSWYFPFVGIYRMCFTKSKKEDKFAPCKKMNTFEDVPNLSVGLSFQGVNKNFGNVVAVEDVTIDIYKGQITALLGHNGAGKTTLINIITGMFSPTKGKLWRDGKNVFDDFSSFQENLGLCPQHDLLFPYLNVVEHVMFFGMLRGLPRSIAYRDAVELLEFFGMSDKANCLTKKLSGGMKRKLSLSISLIGNPKILILDEPTSGMDPESRRDTWNKLLNFRGDRTIILTTHYMEEAEVLGDMIAIMDHGVIKCYGTSLFLKRHYGSGYKVTVPVQYQDAVENIIRSIIPQVSMPVISGSHVSFSIPLEKSDAFSHLFSSLESNIPQNVRIGVACTTLDDVFLKVAHGGIDEVDKVLSDEEVLLNDPNRTDDIHSSSEALTPKASVGLELMTRRMVALFMKKILYNYHRWASWFFLTIFYPFVIFFIPLTLSSSVLKGELSNSPLVMDLTIYGETNVVCSTSEIPSYKKLSDAFISQVKQEDSLVQELKNSSLEEELLKIGDDNLSKYRFSYIISANMSSQTPNMYYSSIGIHSPAIAVNLLYKSLFSFESNKDLDNFNTYNHPFSFEEDICNGMSQQVIAAVPPTIWLFTTPLVLAVVSFSFSRLHHDERLNSGKLLQLMTGTSPILYWTSAFFCDFILFFISALLILLWTYLFDTANLFSSHLDFGILLLIILLACSGSTWFGYLTSYFLRTFSRLFSLNVFIAFLVGQVAFFIINLFKSFDVDGASTANIFHHIFMFYPSYCTSALIFKFIKNLSLYSLLVKCSKGSGITPAKPALFTWTNDGINQELVYITCDCLIFATLIFLTDYGLFGKISNYIFNLYVGKIDQSGTAFDVDVETERNNVEEAMSNLRASQSYVIVDSLGKKYSHKVTAVRNINFLIKKGECFGLLGVNGAGKSTTFKMLTGDLLPSAGQAVLFGHNLRENKLKYQSHIGYCPQTDAIIEALSGIEMLKLYASLRGVNSSIMNRTIFFWITEFGLQSVSNRKCETYSGGNKRKLSTAISLIGDPQVVFLDEPTTGVDPVARRKFWAILEKLQKRGCTIILTSHSMDECETVCDRLTIMVKGEMKCIGNIQRLKDIYGQGYTIMIQLGIYSQTELEALKSSINQTFAPHGILRDEHIGLLHYHINCPDYKWSNLFSIMETIKTNNPAVKEYAISETTLEQIFLHFAKT